MSSASSLETTAASDTSSSADSRYYSGGARRPNIEIPRASSVRVAVQGSAPPVQSPRRRSSNLKARGVVIAKVTPAGNQKVYCVCKVCKGQRMVSKSTCYRHLRVEAEIKKDDLARDLEREYDQWGSARAYEEALRMQGLLVHLPRIPLGL